MSSEECKVERDFLRQIADKVFAEALSRVPMSIVSELRKRLSRLEDTYDFSKFGGRPERLAEALSSQEWSDIVEYAEKSNVLWIIRKILEKAAESYRDGCPRVYERIRQELDRLARREARSEGEEITLDVIYRGLKVRGYRVEYSENKDEVIIDEGTIEARISVSDGMLSYEICKRGKATTLEGVIAKINKIREI